MTVLAQRKKTACILTLTAKHGGHSLEKDNFNSLSFAPFFLVFEEKSLFSTNVVSLFLK